MHERVVVKYVVIVLFLIGAYLVGSIPTGYWFARWFFRIDVMQHGSGNIGATNVARVLGSVKYFFLILLIDAGKAFATLWVAARCMAPILSHDHHDFYVMLLCAVAACLLLGNGFSIFLRGRGGKSVATLVGIVIFLYPWSILLTLLVSWGIVLLLSRKVSIASISAAVIATVVYWIGMPQYGRVLGVFLTAATMWLIWRHTSNIKQFFVKG